MIYTFKASLIKVLKGLQMSKNRNNNSTEEIIWSGRTHAKILVKPILIQIFLIIVHWAIYVYIPFNTSWEWWNNWSQLIMHGIIILIEIWYVIVPILDWRNSSFELTNKRVIKEWGVLEKYSREIPLNRIVSVSVERDIIDRIFRCGTIILQDAASEHQPRPSSGFNKRRNKNIAGVRFHDVPNVLEVKRLIDQARHALD